MQKNKKNLLFVVIIFFILELHLFSTKLFFISLPIINICFIVHSIKFSKNLSNAILPSILASSVSSFTILLENKIIIQILLTSATFFLFWFYNLQSTFLSKRTFDSTSNYKNITLYGNFIAFYFSSSFIYGLLAYLSLNLFWLLILLTPLIALLIYNALNTISLEKKYINSINKTNNIKILWFIICIATVELACIIAFLPFNYMTLGLILSLCNYVTIGLTQHHIKGTLSRHNIQLYISVGLIGIILTTITTRWM